MIFHNFFKYFPKNLKIHFVERIYIEPIHDDQTLAINYFLQLVLLNFSVLNHHLPLRLFIVYDITFEVGAEARLQPEHICRD